MKRGIWEVSAVCILAFSLTGCATFQRKDIDVVIVRDMVCGGRESEAREYMKQRGLRLPDVVERVERTRKECIR